MFVSLSTRRFNAAILMVSTLMLSACGGSGGGDKSTQPPVSGDAAYNGIWVDEAYGFGFKLNNNQGEIFKFGEQFCLLEDEFDDLNLNFTALFNRHSDTQLEYKAGVGARDLYLPGNLLTKVDTMPAACVSGYLKSAGDTGYVKDASVDLNVFADIFAQYSMSIDVLDLDWTEMTNEAKQSITSTSTDMALMESIYQLVEPIHDTHTSIISPVGAVKVFNKEVDVHLYEREFRADNGLEGQVLDSAQIAQANQYIDAARQQYQQNILNYAANPSDVKTAIDGQLVWFENNGIAYLGIHSMLFSEDLNTDNETTLTLLESALDQILTDIQDADALIMDIRINGGGRNFLGMAVASRFTDTELDVYQFNAKLGDGLTEKRTVSVKPRGDIQFVKPIYLLTSASSVSAAETFALAMSAMEHVTLVGEATQGSLSDVLSFTLPNGFEVNLSNEYYYDMDGNIFEYQGVPVDISVPVFDRESREDESDPAIEAVLNILM